MAKGFKTKYINQLTCLYVKQMVYYKKMRKKAVKNLKNIKPKENEMVQSNRRGNKRGEQEE